MDLDFFSVEYAPDLRANVIFTTESATVFREDGAILPLHATDEITVMPWGADNQMPYRIMDLIDADETVTTCMSVNQELAHAAGLEYRLRKDTMPPNGLSDFLDNNSLIQVWLGQCADLKMFDFCITVITLNKNLSRIEHITRKHAAYCRFAPIDPATGRIPYIAYANWRNTVHQDNIEVIPLLDSDRLLPHLRECVEAYPRQRRYAIASVVPKASSTYYPIPAYASLFRSDWYDIKRLIGKAKKAKLRNSAPIKYHIEVHKDYWERAIRDAGISDPAQAKEYIAHLKSQMIDFLSGAENSGKVLFSTVLQGPDGKEIPEVRVTKISSDEKEGGDYTTDIQEAVNMICFTMRVHSNLVGSVPGKSQSNNSGSDKRELYTIAQTLQRPYHNVMLEPHRLICRYNRWSPAVTPTVDIIQLTTLDKHTDLKQV